MEDTRSTTRKLRNSNPGRLPACASALLGIILAATPAQAIDIGDHDLGVTLDFTYATKYMWHGFDVFDDRTSLQPSLAFDYEGFTLGVWGAWPTSNGFEVLTEIDYYANYAHSLFSEERYAIDAAAGFTYFSFPKIDSRLDSEEAWLGISLPNLMPLGPSALIPSYYAYYNWDGVQNSGAVDDGWFHDFGLGYDLPITSWLTSQEEQSVSLSGAITYNDGAYETTSAWSHATVGVSTTLEWKQLYLTPALHYQFSFEDSVNPDDEFYALVSFGYSF